MTVIYVAAVVTIAAGLVGMWAVVGNPRLRAEQVTYYLTRRFYRVKTPVVWVRPRLPMPDERFREALLVTKPIHVIGRRRTIPLPPNGTGYPWPVTRNEYERAKDRGYVLVVDEGMVKLFQHNKPVTPHSGENKGRWSMKRNRQANERIARRLTKKGYRRLRKVKASNRKGTA